MCEFCAKDEKPEVVILKTQEAAGHACEVPKNTRWNSPKCGRPVKYLIKTHDVQAHLCAQHTASCKKACKNDKSMLEYVSNITARKIRSSEEIQCDGSIVVKGGSKKECKRLAKYAIDFIGSLYICGKHRGYL